MRTRTYVRAALAPGPASLTHRSSPPQASYALRAGRKAAPGPPAPLPDCCAQLLGKPYSRNATCTVPGAPPSVFARYPTNCKLCNGTLAGALHAVNRKRFADPANMTPLRCFCGNVGAGLPHGRGEELYVREVRDADVRGGDLEYVNHICGVPEAAPACKVCGGHEKVKAACRHASSDIEYRPPVMVYRVCAGFVMEPVGGCGWLKANVSALAPRPGWTTYLAQPTPP